MQDMQIEGAALEISTVADPLEDTIVVKPWPHRRVVSLLRRWWQLEQSGCSRWPMDRPRGAAYLPARELALTVSVWVESVHRGLRRWHPERRWGREPIVIKWLRASEAADECRRRADAYQRQVTMAGRLGKKLEKDHLRRLWRAAEGAAVSAFRIETSLAFRLFVGRLAIALAICSAEDPAFRRLLNDQNLG